MHQYGPDGRICTCGESACTKHIHDQTLQETAEYIHHHLSRPRSDPGWHDFRVTYGDARRASASIQAIKDPLCAGDARISWLDPKVADAMRAVFGALSSGDYGG